MYRRYTLKLIYSNLILSLNYNTVVGSKETLTCLAALDLCLKEEEEANFENCVGLSAECICAAQELDRKTEFWGLRLDLVSG